MGTKGSGTYNGDLLDLLVNFAELNWSFQFVW
jgi:hypothetical protein